MIALLVAGGATREEILYTQRQGVPYSGWGVAELRYWTNREIRRGKFQIASDLGIQNLAGASIQSEQAFALLQRRIHELTNG